jgi:hypothetical protein
MRCSMYEALSVTPIGPDVGHTYAELPTSSNVHILTNTDKTPLIRL